MSHCALAALAAVLAGAVAQPVSDVTSTVFDPVGDARFNVPAFQDVVFGQMTKTASGDFELLMEMAGPVPASPPLPPPGVNEIWWMWAFDLDPNTSPVGYPFGGPAFGRRPEFVVYVSWDGTDFAGTAIDRRPLLTGGEAIVTPVAFSINGAIVEANLPFELIGDVPPSFRWGPSTFGWSGPVGSEGVNSIDQAETVFSP